jgi:hypothetical protein
MPRPVPDPRGAGAEEYQDEAPESRGKGIPLYGHPVLASLAGTIHTNAEGFGP